MTESGSRSFTRFLRTLVLLLVVFLLLGQQGQASNNGLRELRAEVWEECNIVSTEPQTQSFSESFLIDGAVGTDGSAKVTIEDWENKAISSTGDKVKLYPYAKGGGYIGYLEKDTVAFVLMEKEERFLVQSGRITGYVDKGEIVLGQEAKMQADIVCPVIVVTDAPNTQIRTQSDIKSASLAYMEQRVPYNIIGEGEEWYRVVMPDSEKGYVEKSKVKEVRVTHLAYLKQEQQDRQKQYRVTELSNEERKLLAAIVFCEARGDTFEGQRAVAAVVLNRVESEKFPNSVSDVIYQDGQFVPVQEGDYERVLENPDIISPSCYEAADAVIQGQNEIISFLFFDRGGRGEKIGSHWFN